jgi:hypothetical protein
MFLKFGFGSYEEMCFDFLYYYPDIYQLEKCGSTNSEKALYDFYRSLQRLVFKLRKVKNLSNIAFFSSEKLLPPRVLNESNYEEDAFNGLTQAYLNTGNFGPEFAERFTNFFRNEYDKISFCGVWP